MEGTRITKIRGTLGREVQNPFAKEQRLKSLHQSLRFSIDTLDSNIQKLLPLLTIFHSPFPAEAVKKIFEIGGAQQEDDEDIPLVKKIFEIEGQQPEDDEDIPLLLYNKSLLARLEKDRQGPLNDKYWLYTFIPAIRSYLEYAYVDDISTKQKDIDFIGNFCSYYQSLAKKTYDAWGTDNHTNVMRRFDLMSLSEGKNDFYKAIEYAEKITSDDKQREYWMIMDGSSMAWYLGLIYERLGQYDKSLENHKKSLNINKRINKNSEVLIADNYLNMGVVYYNKGQYDRALTYYNKALEIHEECNFTVAMATDYTNIGNVYLQKEQYDEALKYYNKSLEIDQNLDQEAKNFSNIGIVYKNKGQYNEALTYHKEALKLHKFLDRRVEFAADYSNIGLVYYDARQYDDALIYFNKALKIYKNINERVYLVYAYSRIGLAYLGKKDKAKAKEVADNALAITNEFKKDTDTEHPVQK